MTPLEDGNVAVPEAAIVTAAASCAEDGFVIANEKMYSVPAAKVWPVKTVSVNVPALNAPFPCDVPSPNKSAALCATLVSARLGLSGAPVSPDIVRLELWCRFILL